LRKNSTNGNRGFSNTLPSPRRRQMLKDATDEEAADADAAEGQVSILKKIWPMPLFLFSIHKQCILRQLSTTALLCFSKKTLHRP
jgi:hypothetical protein